MADSLRAKMAPVYQHLLSELFDRPAIPETRATCDDCAMCDKGQNPGVKMDFFKPDVKCCTYHPHLPNYLVGAILAEGDEYAEGKRRIRERIAKRTMISPCWVAAPKKYQLIAMASKGSNVFGRAKSMLCPYYDSSGNGSCSIWRHRESVCTTFFCKYERGRHGLDFWTGIKAYFEHIEITFAHWAMKEVDPKLVEPKLGRLKLTVEDVDDLPPNPAEYAELWQGWVDREAEFYLACYEKVRSMTREKFEELIDEAPDGKKNLLELRRRWDKMMNPELPKALVRNPKMKTAEVESAMVVTTYNPNDSFAVDKDLYEVLGLLDASKTLEENLRTLEAEHGVELAPELLAHLVMHGVLVTPPKKPAEACATKDG